MIEESKIKNAFYGTDVEILNADGELKQRIYFDSAASTLLLKASHEVVRDYSSYYANPHSNIHLAAKMSTAILQNASDKILRFFGASKEDYSVVFIGNGSTAALSRIAEGLSKIRKDKPLVVLSVLEHHSNDLPHRVHNKRIEHVRISDDEGNYIGIDLKATRKILLQNKDEINYLAITGASNVTGQMPPVKELAELAHEFDAYIVVDGAQLASHVPVSIDEDQIDFFAFSGHKLYAPGSPGVLIGRKEILSRFPPSAFGGGMVSDVSLFDFQVSTDVFRKEHAGTPNVLGILSLVTAIGFLEKIGMEKVYEKEKILTQLLLKEMSEIPGIQLYPKGANEDRIGVISFNVEGIPHELLASILNDYFCIAVRNECFCAHPLVRDCLLDMLWEINEEETHLYQGMVRVSLGIYNTPEEVMEFIQALKQIVNHIQFYRSQYKLNQQCQFEHLNYSQNTQDYFDFDKELCLRFKAFLEEN